MKPKICSTEEVRAILDGRKTMFCEVVKPANKRKSNAMGGYKQGDGLWVDKEKGYIKDYSVSSCWYQIEEYIKKYAKYQPGDTLYVRETWRSYPWEWNDLSGKMEMLYSYKEKYDKYPELKDVKWQPPVTMPKEAARIFLKVTGVEVKRVQDLTREERHKHGIKKCKHEKSYTISTERMHAIGIDSCDCSIKKIEEIWNAKHAKQGYGWDANPWIWVYEFERVENQ